MPREENVFRSHKGELASIAAICRVANCSVERGVVVSCRADLRPVRTLSKTVMPGSRILPYLQSSRHPGNEEGYYNYKS